MEECCGGTDIFILLWGSLWFWLFLRVSQGGPHSFRGIKHGSVHWEILELISRVSVDNKMKIKTMNDQFPIKNWNAIHTIANSEDSSTRFNIKINLLSRKVFIVWIVLRVKCILFCVKKQLRLVDLWRNIPFLNSLLMASSKTTLEILRYKCPSKPSRWFNHELLGKTRNCTHINLMIYTD